MIKTKKRLETEENLRRKILDMLQPKQTKFRKYHRGKMRGLSTRASTLNNGDSLVILKEEVRFGLEFFLINL